MFGESLGSILSVHCRMLSEVETVMSVLIVE